MDPDRAAPVGAIRSGVTLFTSLFKLVNIMRQQTASADGNIWKFVCLAVKEDYILSSTGLLVTCFWGLCSTDILSKVKKKI